MSLKVSLSSKQNCKDTSLAKGLSTGIIKCEQWIIRSNGCDNNLDLAIVILDLFLADTKYQGM